MSLTRFSVAPLHTLTRTLAAVAMGRELPDQVLTGARLLSTYTERLHADREIWLKAGRIAAVKPAGTARKVFPKLARAKFFDAAGGILAPGLVDPHIHIESSMMTACAYAEGALLNGTTTIFCDSHEIGNVCDSAGIEWMLEDARQAPLSIFLTVPSTVPATSPQFETAGGDLTAAKIGKLFDRYPEAVALGEKMDFVQVAMGDPRSHAIMAAALKRGRPICGHIYGREFVTAGAASGITDTHEAIDREIGDDFLEAGVWIFLRGGPPTTPWHSLPHAIKAVTELCANPKRVCVCTDDRDADDLFLFGLDWVARQAVVAGLKPTTAWSLGSSTPPPATAWTARSAASLRPAGPTSSCSTTPSSPNALGMAANSSSKTARSRRCSIAPFQNATATPAPPTKRSSFPPKNSLSPRAPDRSRHRQRHPHRSPRHHPLPRKSRARP